MLVRTLSFLLLFAFAVPVWAQVNFKSRIEQTATAECKTDTGRLHALFALNQEIEEETSPEGNTWRGKPKHQDKWTDMSAAAIESRRETQRQLQQAFTRINRSKLGKADQLNYDLFTNKLNYNIEGFRFPGHLMPVNKTFGFQLSIPQVLSLMRLEKEQDYRNYISRLQRLPAYIDQQIALMQLGIKQDIVPPRTTLEGVLEQVEALQSADPEKSVLADPSKICLPLYPTPPGSNCGHRHTQP